MWWMLLALLAAFVWAIANDLDKILIENRIPEATNYLVLQGLIGLLPTSAFGLLADPGFCFDSPIIAIAFLSGLLEVVFSYFYYRALKIADASVVVTAVQIVPVFTSIIGFLFLEERFGPHIYIGMLMVVAGTATVAYEPDDRNNRYLLLLFLMLPAVLSVSVAYALESYSLKFIGVNTLFFWGRVGFFVGSLISLVWPRTRRVFFEFLPSLSVGLVSTLLMVELLNLLGIYLLNFAYAFGPLSLVSTLASVQPVFVLLTTVFINGIWPNTIPDNKSRERILTRIFAIAVVVAGILLINVNS